MNKQEEIRNYKVGQKVAIYGYIDAIDIENISDIENTTTLRIKTPVKTISINPKYEEVVTDFNKSKQVVPQFVADFYESIKDDFEYKVYELCLQYKHRGDELPQGVAWWFGDSRNKPIETLVMMHKFGYEVEKEKLYRAKNKQTGEYLCYCFGFFHDKNSSSENQRFTAEEKRWKELGYWNNDLYVFEEAEGEDE